MDALIVAYLIARFVSIVFGLYVLFISIVRYIQLRVKIILLMSSMMTYWVLFTLAAISINLPEEFLSNELFGRSYLELLLIISVCFAVLTISLSIVFFVAFSGESSNFKIAVALGAFLSILVLSLAAISYQSDITVSAFNYQNLRLISWSPLTYLIVTPQMLFLFYWAYSDLNESKKYAISQTQLNQINIMQLGVFLNTIASTLIGIFSEILFKGQHYSLWFSEVLSFFCVSIGLLLTGVAYTASKRVVFFLPQRVERMLIVHKSGITILNYNFRKNDIEIDEDIMSNNIQTIPALLKEAFAVSSEIKSINFSDYTLMIKIKETIAFVLVTNRRSAFLVNALDDFVKEFVRKFENELQRDHVYDLTLFEEAIPILRRNFGLDPMEE